MMPALTSQETKQLLAFQTNEITEHHIYHQLSLLQKNENNRRILTELAAEESGHYQLLKTYTQKEVGPKKGKVRFYVWIARLFGLTFSIKLMENMLRKPTVKLIWKIYKKLPGMKKFMNRD